MWFYLALLALTMQLARRTSEKVVSENISSSAMAWIQQAVAMPFIIFSLFFVKFYRPDDLSGHFWTLMFVYVICVSIDLYCYFKALSFADISYIAPLLTLTAVGNIVGAYFVLHQTPSLAGFAGAIFIVLGAGIFYYIKRKDIANVRKNTFAAILILILVIVRAYFSNIEVLMIRESNPAVFNFYSSLLTIPFVLLLSVIIIKSNKSAKLDNYWKNVRSGVVKHKWFLVFIGLTYTVNMLATYTAKLTAPSAGYVGAIKSASVLPMVLIGIIFFKEKVQGWQWFGLFLIAIGLGLLAIN